MILLLALLALLALLVLIVGVLAFGLALGDALVEPDPSEPALPDLKQLRRRATDRVEHQHSRKSHT